MDNRRLLIGAVICLVAFIIGSASVFFLEALGHHTSGEEEEEVYDKIIVSERASLIKILTAVFEMTAGIIFFEGYIKNLLMRAMSERAAYNTGYIIIALAVLILTSALCNVLPRKLGLKREKFSDAVYAVGRVVYAGIAPVWWIQNVLGNVTAFFFGVKNIRGERVTEEKILQMVDEGSESGTINESQVEMINNIFDFDETLVSDVMSHRKDIVAVEDTMTLDEAIQLSVKEGYSRMPVYRGDIDNIIGVVHAKDLLSIIHHSKNTDIPVTKFLRKVMYVPETANCSDVLKMMLKNKTQIAIVSDEYGGTFGLVCLEDLLEEIVGNIQDEYDNEEVEVSKIDDETYIIDGDARPEDVFEELDIKLPEGDKYDTMSGLVVDLLGYVPDNDTNPTVTYEGNEIQVLKVEDNWIAEVRLKIIRNS